MGSLVAVHAVSAPLGRNAEFQRRRGGKVRDFGRIPTFFAVPDEVVVVVAGLLMALCAADPNDTCTSFQGVGFRV